MDITQIACALEVRKYGSFTRAADALYISQPYLSQIIRKLEQEIGKKLFIRTTKSVAPTSYGEVFFKQAEKVMESWNGLISLGLQREKRLRVAMLERMKTLRLPKTIGIFHQQHPEINIEVETVDERDLPHLFDDSQFDCALLRWSVAGRFLKDESYVCEAFFHEPVEVLMGGGHPLASAKSLRAEDLREYKLLLDAKNTVAARQMPFRLKMQDLQDSFSSISSNNYDVLAEILRQNDTVILGSPSVADYYGLTHVPLEPVSYNAALLVCRAEKKKSPELKSFRQFIAARYSEY